jgi:hypothetical protein
LGWIPPEENFSSIDKEEEIMDNKIIGLNTLAQILNIELPKPTIREGMAPQEIEIENKKARQTLKNKIQRRFTTLFRDGIKPTLKLLHNEWKRLSSGELPKKNEML